MSREWRSESDAGWLKARKSYLTASEISGIIPEYKRIKKGKVKLSESSVFAKVYGEKMSTEIDCMSYGAAARGHVMEPYAVDEANRVLGTDEFHWWDDKIITDGAVGYSPDALNIHQLPGTRIISRGGDLLSVYGTHEAPSALMECKCYQAKAHYQKMLMASNGTPLDERWQVACGMAVCPTVTEGHLVFYAPQCGNMFIESYTRSMLSDEMAVIWEIADMWLDFKSHMSRVTAYGTLETEDSIYKKYSISELIG